MNTNFEQYAHYYDLIYRDKNYIAEADYVIELIKQHNPQAQTILELGSGTGGHAIIFAQRNYRVHGIDISEQMVNLAQSKSSTQISSINSRISFQTADLRTLALDTTFDVVISLFHVMSYQTSNQDLQQAFMSAHKHLKPGGLFIFDCWYGPAVLTEQPSERSKKFEDSTLLVTRNSIPKHNVNDNRVDVHFDLDIFDKKTATHETVQESHAMRYLFKPEVEILMQSAGFTLCGFEEWLTGAQPTDHSWNVCFVGKKQ
jgi:SAM-dependent methyltransferase